MKLKNDFFWKSYCRYFAEDKKPVVAPSNFCAFFWISLFGSILRGSDKISIFYNWIPAWFCAVLSAMSLGLVYGIGYLVDSGLIEYSSSWATLSMIPLALMFLSFLITGSIKSVTWLWGKFVKPYTSDNFRSGVEKFLYGLMIWAFVSLILNVPKMAAAFGKLVLWLPPGMAAIALVSAIVIALALGVGWLCGHAASLSIIQNIGRYCKSVKTKVCPIVEPPDCFLEELKKREAECITSGNSLASSTPSSS